MRPCWILKSAALLSLFVLAPAAPAGPATKEAKLVEKVTNQKLFIADDGHPQLAITDQLKTGKRTLVAFTNFAADPSSPGDTDVQLNLISEKGALLASAIACEAEGGPAALRTFFFANADAESDLEIAVICGWKEHPAADCQTYDQARFFKVREKAPQKFELEALDLPAYKALYHAEKSVGDPSLKCEGMPNFKNAKDVKRLLSKMKF